MPSTRLPDEEYRARRAERARRYYQQNRERLLARQKERDASRREERAEYARAYRERMKREDPEELRARRRAKYAARREEALERQRWINRRGRTGITKQQFERLWAAQGGRCPACSDELTDGGAAGAHVDHCHKSGKIRGILCAPCNKALGAAREDVERLRGLAAFLEAH